MSVRRVRRGRNDDGYTLILTAVCIVIMLGFTAVAVDLGNVYNQRRQDQTGADIAALGAAQDLGDDTAAVTNAISLVNASLDTPLSAASFNTCAGETIQEPGFTKSTVANCIAFDALRKKMRVRVPLQEADSTFGGVVGVESYEHTAYAVAETYRAGFGGVLPFGITGSAGTYECLKTGAANVPSSECSTNYSGNFGFVNIAWHGDIDLGTTTSCTGQGKNRLPNNVAVGLDHDLSRFNQPPHFATRVIDTTSCGNPARPNSLETLTGNIPNEMGNGIFAGTGFSDGGNARLQRTDVNLGWSSTTSVSGFVLDDNPLWDFIPDSLAGADVPRSCWRDQFIGDYGGLNVDNDEYMSALPSTVTAHLITMPVEERTNRLLQRCLTHYVGDSWDDNGAYAPAEPPIGCIGSCSDPVFSRNSSTSDEPDLWDIQYTSRFGYVPQMVGTWPGGSSTPIDIDRFKAVFLQRLFAGNCDTSGCGSQFDPGVGYSDTSSSSKASALTAFVFPDSMLPGDLGSADGPNQIGANVFVRLIR